MVDNYDQHEGAQYANHGSQIRTTLLNSDAGMVTGCPKMTDGILTDSPYKCARSNDEPDAVLACADEEECAAMCAGYTAERCPVYARSGCALLADCVFGVGERTVLRLSNVLDAAGLNLNSHNAAFEARACALQASYETPRRIPVGAAKCDCVLCGGMAKERWRETPAISRWPITGRCTGSR